jgi:NAD(P)-dependent dehydrogenase (short-subunit alcohol dehydrogenase family)
VCKLNDQLLEGKTALVTGGGGLLGQVFCESLANSGAQVIVADIDGAAAEKVAHAVNTKYPGKAISIQCDVSDPKSVGAMVKDIESTETQVDVLINNAATKTNNLDDFFEPFETFTLKTWQEVNSINLDGMFLVAQAIGNHMIKNGTPGSIVQISSIYGVNAPDKRIYEGSEYNGRPINTPAVYSVSKAGVIALSNYLAAYWGDKGLRINTISPGGVFSGQNTEFVDRYSERVPMRRMGSAEELTGAVLLLASDKSSYMTGQNIVIDGGLSVW